MKLIGMLDSPYVRRTAISLECLGISFEHHAVSVFKTFPEFQTINPVVKAPTLILDDGTILMDSNLIIQYAETVAQKSLLPASLAEKAGAFRILGLALAACEKAVQIVYETNLRPAEIQFEPWLTRIKGQLLAACKGLENELTVQPELFFKQTTTQTVITSAVAWQFINSMVPDVVPAEDYPLLVKLSANAEIQMAFNKYPPIGPGVMANNK